MPSCPSGEKTIATGPGVSRGIGEGGVSPHGEERCACSASRTTRPKPRIIGRPHPSRRRASRGVSGCGGFLVQKGKAFSVAEISVKAGETVMYVNDDTVTSAGNAFNLGPQKPGASSPVPFKSAGEVMVGCAIHPHMKLTVTVTN
jgi:hypothetical protein